MPHNSFLGNGSAAVDRIEIMELEQLMLEREAMYSFLARMYREEVDCELIRQISQVDISAMSSVPEISADLQMLVRDLCDAKDITLTELAAEYARIFLGTGPTQSGGAFPYESVYTSPRGLLMQEARDQVVKLYQQEGVQRSADFHEPEDHLALELEFMSFLCQKTNRIRDGDNVNILSRCLQNQQDFLERHLLNWVPRFCADVKRCAHSNFYRTVAQITSGYLTLDHDLVVDVLSLIQANTA
jgi:putative dimethyl sulfoxide reductase chaperone